MCYHSSLERYIDQHLPLYSNSRQLRTSLGPWTTTTPSGWEWFRDNTTDTLYSNISDIWNQYDRQPSLGNYAHYHHPQPCPTPNVSFLAPISIHKLPTFIQVCSVGTTAIRPNPIVNTLHQLIEKEGTDASWAVKHLQCTDDGANIAHAIQSGTLTIVSDSSLKHGLGTSAFILETPDRQHTIRGVNQVPGPISEGNSHRCKMAGIYGALICLKNICTLHNITTGHVTIACDNLDAVGSLDQEYQPHPRHNNFGLTLAVHSIQSALPLSVSNEHVKAHQKKAWSQLNCTEQLNELMDKTAKAYWIHLTTAQPLSPMPQPTAHPIKYEGWQIWQGMDKLTRPAPATTRI